MIVWLLEPSASHVVFEGEATAEATEETTAEEDEEDIEQDEQDDLELAWETLDTARVIYSKMESEDAKISLGDVHMLLGDVSLESGKLNLTSIENFDQAASDFEEALEIKSKILDADDRELAEAHYKLALAYEYTEHFKEAVEEVEATVKNFGFIE